MTSLADAAHHVAAYVAIAMIITAACFSAIAVLLLTIAAMPAVGVAFLVIASGRVARRFVLTFVQRFIA